MPTFLAVALTIGAAAQGISLEKGWKFSTGDSAQWASPTYNDQNWKSIDVQRPW